MAGTSAGLCRTRFQINLDCADNISSLVTHYRQHHFIEGQKGESSPVSTLKNFGTFPPTANYTRINKL